MDLWLTLGITPTVGVGAALSGLACAGAVALWRLKMGRARAKALDLGLDR